MNHDLARKVANSVLYEGYMLYPYRPSAIKNRQRWTFGILYPPAYAEVKSGTERAMMHSECLVEVQGEASIKVELRFLHLTARQVSRSVEGKLEPVPSLLVNDRVIESWDEGVERSLEFEVSLQDSRAQTMQFGFPASYRDEWLRITSGQIAGRVSRTQHEVRGNIVVTSQKVRRGVVKLTIEVTNQTRLPGEDRDRNAALQRSLVSAHTILTVSCGGFVSLLDPPDDMKEDVKTCKNIGNFPVLVGADDERDMVLCSPIVLYDHPKIAPESVGDFYDSTEMDEMLTLRVMTLSEPEKDEMRLADDRVRNLLLRTEQTARDQLMKTHGTIRGMRRIG